jgi:hypothetical protein
MQWIYVGNVTLMAKMIKVKFTLGQAMKVERGARV